MSIRLRSLPASALLACLATAASAAGTPGRFDYYVLTLSWSPTFCRSHAGSPECSRHLGFVLHGLWPQYAKGGYPHDCSTTQKMTPDAEALGEKIFPSPGLMLHEWNVHGSCDGRSPLAYFQSAEQAVQAVRLPVSLEPGTHPASLRSRQIVDALRAANPALPANGLAIGCASGELSQIQVCLNRDLSPRACGKGVASSCGPGVIELPGAH